MNSQYSFDLPLPDIFLTFTFRDSARHRPIVTEVWYPTDDTLQQTDKAFSAFVRKPTVRNGRLPVGKWPLIMLSHGTGGGRLTLEWLSQALAEKGWPLRISPTIRPSTDMRCIYR